MRAESTGIHGNIESGNHPAPHTDESMETLNMGQYLILTHEETTKLQREWEQWEHKSTELAQEQSKML